MCHFDSLSGILKWKMKKLPSLRRKRQRMMPNAIIISKKINLFAHNNLSALRNLIVKASSWGI